MNENIIDDDEFLYGDSVDFSKKENDETALDSKILDSEIFEEKENTIVSPVPEIIMSPSITPEQKEITNATEFENLLENNNHNIDTVISTSLDLNEDYELPDSDDDIEFVFGDSISTSFPKVSQKETDTVEADDKGEKIEPKNEKEILSVEDGKLDILSTPMLNSILLYDYDFGMGTEKPWCDPGSDITDYFNFGFTEQTWRIYCVKQKRLRERYNSNAITAEDRNSLLPPELAILKPEPIQNMPPHLLPNFPHNMHGLQNQGMSIPMPNMLGIPGMPGMPMMHGMHPGMQNRMPIMMPPIGMGNIAPQNNTSLEDTSKIEEIKDSENTSGDNLQAKSLDGPDLTKDSSILDTKDSSLNDTGNIATSDKSAITSNIESNSNDKDNKTSANTDPNLEVVAKKGNEGILPIPANLQQNFIPGGAMMNIGGMNRPLNQMMMGAPMGLPFGMNGMMPSMGHMPHMGNLGPMQGRPIMHNFPGKIDGPMGFPGNNPQSMFIGNQPNMIRPQNNQIHGADQNQIFNGPEDLGNKNNSSQNFSQNKTRPNSILQPGSQNISQGSDNRNQGQGQYNNNSSNFNQRDFRGNNNKNTNDRNEDPSGYDGRSNNDSSNYNYNGDDDYDQERNRNTSSSGRGGRNRFQDYNNRDLSSDRRRVGSGGRYEPKDVRQDRQPLSRKSANDKNQNDIGSEANSRQLKRNRSQSPNTAFRAEKRNKSKESRSMRDKDKDREKDRDSRDKRSSKRKT
ncbi:Pre-mRNA polyadenylation factor FIP1 [Smittium culicis]|uniref:Pre-mRNA polyadenylation factor FIP1 n=1 Tax=Smittium culicis TaxID=133412 RepID=A0A1R1X4X9_9FUNG|nr:Pre-mRNA polyadenylation factor FIP1 [Smittium culicis]